MPDTQGEGCWYQRYFTADYWTYASAEYTPERTAAEVEYLAAVLVARAPGCRVLDLGCGIGRHAVGLAQRGFRVTGLDVSQWALDRAHKAAADVGVELDLHRVDLLDGRPLPVTDVDAAVCVQAFGWGSDADQVRMLRSVRAALRPGGVLLLDHSNISVILRGYLPESTALVEDTSFHFLRRYDAVTGRSTGEVRVRRPDGSTAVLPDDVRMYQPPEVRALLVRAGFTVSAVDAEFVRGGPVTMDSRYVQFTATVPALPRSALAGHRRTAPEHCLDLRWAVDEIDFVRPELDAVMAEVTGSAGHDLGDRARRYDLADPYLSRCASTIAAHFGQPLEPDQVTAGAGATGLLRALAGLAVGSTVLADPAGHPELPEAAAALGVSVEAIEPAEPADMVAAIRSAHPAVTVLDRPGVPGRVPDLDEVLEIAEAAAATGGVLVVDETCASYLAPAASAIRLVGRSRGLIVLRSLSKGYCCGGLRVGFAVSSHDVAARVRAVASPLPISAVSIDVAEALLRRGDILAPLRARIAEVKPGFVAALKAAGFAVDPTDPRLPWVLLPGNRETHRKLTARRLLAKEVPTPTGDLLRLSVPLSATRLRRAGAALDGP